MALLIPALPPPTDGIAQEQETDLSYWSCPQDPLSTIPMPEVPKSGHPPHPGTPQTPSRWA